MNRFLSRTISMGVWPVLLSATLTGCGGGDAESTPTGTVSGVVLFNESPVEAGTVNLEAPGTGNAAQATITKGAFVFSEPLVVGNYKVTISPPPEPPPVADQTRPPVEAKDIPAKYRDPKTSELTAEVKEGANEFTFKLMP